MRGAARRERRTVDGDLAALAAREVVYGRERGGVGFDDVIHERDTFPVFEFLGQFETACREVDTDDEGDAEDAGELGGGETDGTEARDEETVATGDVHAREAFPGGPEAAGHEGPVDKGERLGERDAVLLFGEDVRGVAAVTLPAVGFAMGGTLAGDLVAVHAVGAAAAAGDVVEDDTIAEPAFAAAWTDFDDASTGLVARDDVLVGFGAFAEVFPVDRPDIGPADGGSARADENLAFPGVGDGESAKLDGGVSGKDDAGHCVGKIVHRSGISL